MRCGVMRRLASSLHSSSLFAEQFDDRDKQRTHIGYIARISDDGEATIKLTEAGTKIMTPATLARYARGWHVGVTLPPKQQHGEGQ